MSRILPSLISGLVLGLVSTLAVQAADTYQVDPQHAWVSFTINHAGWANAHGSFDTVSGSIGFDREDVSKSSVSIAVETSSLDTGFADRDRDLLSPDFFNADEFAQITFVSTAIEKTGDNTGRVTGDLTLVGVTKSITLDATFNGEAALPWDANVIKAGFTASGSFLPADFGMNKVTEFGLGPEVKITIDVEAFKQ